MVLCLDHAVADASSVLLQVACCDSQLREGRTVLLMHVISAVALPTLVDLWLTNPIVVGYC